MDRPVQRSLSSQLDIAIPSSFAPENEVTLYHGNCLDFLQSIPDETVQLLVTSPPYNIGKEYEDVLDIDVYKAQQRQVVKARTGSLVVMRRLTGSPGQMVKGTILH
jgi:hypothetical protein